MIEVKEVSDNSISNLTKSYYNTYQNYFKPKADELFTRLITNADKQNNVVEKKILNRHWKNLYDEVDYLLSIGLETAKEIEHD